MARWQSCRSTSSWEKIQLIQGQNLGYVGSFFECLRQAPNCDFYAFCDQDDIWLTDKLSTAVRHLRLLDLSKPALYASELYYCDQNCEHPRQSHLNQIGISAQNMLYEVICSGNTQVFNRSLAKLALRHGPDGVFSHDWWFAMVAANFGTITFDETPHILYRRLSENTSPSGMHGLHLLQYRLQKILAKGKLARIHRQIEVFYQTYGDLLPQKEARLAHMASSRNNIAKAFAPGRYRQKELDELSVRLLLLCNQL